MAPMDKTLFGLLQHCGFGLRHIKEMLEAQPNYDNVEQQALKPQTEGMRKIRF